LISPFAALLSDLPTERCSLVTLLLDFENGQHVAAIERSGPLGFWRRTGATMKEWPSIFTIVLPGRALCAAPQPKTGGAVELCGLLTVDTTASTVERHKRTLPALRRNTKQMQLFDAINHRKKL
jgi:hypothetical protein